MLTKKSWIYPVYINNYGECFLFVLGGNSSSLIWGHNCDWFSFKKNEYWYILCVCFKLLLAFFHYLSFRCIMKGLSVLWTMMTFLPNTKGRDILGYIWFLLWRFKALISGRSLLASRDVSLTVGVCMYMFKFFDCICVTCYFVCSKYLISSCAGCLSSFKNDRVGFEYCTRWLDGYVVMRCWISLSSLVWKCLLCCPAWMSKLSLGRKFGFLIFLTSTINFGRWFSQFFSLLWSGDCLDMTCTLMENHNGSPKKPASLCAPPLLELKVCERNFLSSHAWAVFRVVLGINGFFYTCRFTPKMLVQDVRDKFGLSITSIIDLTFTDRYYQSGVSKNGAIFADLLFVWSIDCSFPIICAWNRINNRRWLVYCFTLLVVLWRFSMIEHLCKLGSADG